MPRWSTYWTSSPGWSDVLKLLVVVIVADETGRFRFAADGPRVRGDESARRRGLSSRRSPSLSDNYASRYGSDRHRVRGAYLHGPVDG